MNLDLVKTKDKFTLGFVPVLKAHRDGDGKMRLSGVASSTIQDRHGDTMNRSALDDMLDQSNRLTIFLNHSYEVPEDVAGTVEKASLKNVSSDIHDLSFDIVINDKNERAVKTWEAIESGTKLGLSIGAMIPDGGAKRDPKNGTYQINHVELVETSIVGVPANPRSWVEYATKALRKQDNEMVEALTPLVTTSWASTDANGRLVETTTTSTAPFVFKLDPDSETETEAPADPDAASDDEVDETNVEPEAEEAALSTDELLALADAAAPGKTDATVTVETPFANITVDTGNRGKDPAAASDASSQEAPLSDPETESATTAEAPPPWMGVPGNPPVQQAGEPEFTSATVATQLNQSTQLIASLSRELSEVRLALTEERNARTAAERERDEFSAALTKTLRETDALLSKLSKTPLGRKTNFHEAVGRFEAIRSVYGDELTERLARSIQT